MSSRNGNGEPYFDAARRKDLIAKYHLEELSRRLADAPKCREILSVPKKFTAVNIARPRNLNA